MVNRHGHDGNLAAAAAGWSAVHLLVLGLGFAAALAADRDWFTEAWHWLLEPSVPSRFVLWMLMLPLTVAVWGWRSPASLARVLVIMGIALAAVAAAVGLSRLVKRGTRPTPHEPGGPEARPDDPGSAPRPPRPRKPEAEDISGHRIR